MWIRILMMAGAVMLFWSCSTEESPTPTPISPASPLPLPTDTPTQPPTSIPQATETPPVENTPTVVAIPTEQPTEQPTERPTERPTEQPTPTPTATRRPVLWHEVQPGQTLSGIANHYYGDWRRYPEIQDSTNIWGGAGCFRFIENPNLIYPGDCLAVPVDGQNGY